MSFGDRIFFKVLDTSDPLSLQRRMSCFESPTGIFLEQVLEDFEYFNNFCIGKIVVTQMPSLGITTHAEMFLFLISICRHQILRCTKVLLIQLGNGHCCITKRRKATHLPEGTPCNMIVKRDNVRRLQRSIDVGK